GARAGDLLVARLNAQEVAEDRPRTRDRGQRPDRGVERVRALAPLPDRAAAGVGLDVEQLTVALRLGRASFDDRVDRPAERLVVEDAAIDEVGGVGVVA